ncbi:MAG: M48 family metalloprotease [Novosphingobium sp.]
MAAIGYVTLAAENRKRLIQVLGLYVLAFQMIGGLAATFFLIAIDPAHIMLVDPIGYFVRYGLPMALIAAALFTWIYQGHAAAVEKKLAIVNPSRIDEPRFVTIAERECIALGIRLPRFGIIDVPQPNALAVGEGPSRGLIAVTRGLLDQLDDEELAVVIAQQAAHIRNGDTQALAANYALMRTAVLLQVNNPLRFEDWRQMLIPILLPPMLLLMLLSGMITKASMGIARMARRSVKLSRFHIADADAVRVTHRPDALYSALVKIGGKGAFAGSEAFDDLLFDGRSDSDGGTHPAVVERLQTISRMGRDLMQPGRPRQDTRLQELRGDAPRPTFGRKLDPEAFVAAPIPPAEKPRKPRQLNQEELLKLMLTDWKTYKEYISACNNYYEWRESDNRNFLGLKPEMRIPVMAATAFLTVLYWPADGDWQKFANRFSPAFFSQVLATPTGTFCAGSGCPNG